MERNNLSQNFSNQRGNCPHCNRSYIIRRDGQLRQHGCAIAFPTPTSSQETSTTSLPSSLVEPVSTANSIILTQSSQVQPSVSVLPSYHTDPNVRDPVLNNVPPTIPNIYYKAADQRLVINWTNIISEKLRRLHDADQRNDMDDIQTIISDIYRCSHPKAKTGMIQPNLAADDDDLIDVPQELTGVEEYPILSENKQSIVWTAIRNGHISKARRAMSSDSVGDISEKIVRDQITKKYPSDPTRYIPQPAQATSDIDFAGDATNGRVLKYIFSFKRGQAASALGWSMDYWQDVLFYQPDSIHGIVIIIKLILNNNLSDQNRSTIMLGRGVPLIQRNGELYKARPITIGDPLEKVAAHILGQSVAEDVRTACGKFQLGNGISGGIDILIWTIRLLLELNPNYVIFKSDCNNAFNSCHHSAILDSVNQHIPTTSPYCYSLLKEPLVTDYCNFKRKQCLRVTMQRGVPQGNPISGTFFNITRADALSTVRSNHPSIFLLSFHDDDYFIGPPNDIFQAIHSFDTVMQPLGLSRNELKCQLYDPSGVHDDLEQLCIEAQCAYINREEGIIVCGAPVGSLQFQRRYIQSVVEISINKQLDDLRRIFLTPNGQLKRDIQTIYQLIRLCIPSQLTFLLRTCIPDVTSEASRTLDKVIDEFLILLFDARHHITAMDNAQKAILIKRIHLQFSKGGLGITPSEAIVEAAFVGSLSLSFKYMCSIIPNLKTVWEASDSRSYVLFTRSLQSARDICPQLQAITLDSMETTQYHYIQRLISNSLQKVIEEEVDRSVNQGRPAGGAEMRYANLTPWEQEQAIQHMANKVPFNYAFLLANPHAQLCSMSNDAFTRSVKARLLLPDGEQWSYCQCNREVGPLFSHCYRCPVAAVRNPIRNALHKDLKARFSDIIKARICSANLNRRVLDTEPRLADYFARIDPPPGEPPEQVSTYDARGFEDGVKVRADLVVQMNDLNKAHVIDFTFVEPTSQTYFHAYNKAYQAALKGREQKLKNEYKHWQVIGGNNIHVTNNFQIIAVETFGIMLKDDIHSFFSQFIHEKENRSQVLNLVTQQLSVAVHTMRSIQFHAMKNVQVFQERRIVPATNRNRTIVRMLA